MLVARWEFMRNFKWKQEIIGYLMMLVIYLAIFAVQVWESSSQQKLVTLGIMGSVEVELDESFTLSELPDDLTRAQIFKEIDNLNLDAVLQKTDVDAFTLYAPQQSKWQDELEAQLSAQFQSQQLSSLALTKEQFDELLNPISFRFVNKVEESEGASTQALGIFAAILSAIAVFTSFGLSMTSVTQEKQQRITEQLLTCISHQQWVDGKTLGLCFSSLKSLFTTTVFAFVIMLGIAAFTQQSNLLADVTVIMGVKILLFCTIGILFWNYVFVGFSATIDDVNHSGKTSVMLLPMVPIMLAFSVTDEPNGQVATVLSMFPLTSISFMPMRIASMDVPLWQVATSLALLIATLYYARLFASRVFRANITLFGKEPSWTEIWRSMLKSD
jgi:ABC-2 type transport system permease protein